MQDSCFSIWATDPRSAASRDTTGKNMLFSRSVHF
uniref:Aspartic proteinase oryzasin-1 n=1 Tax=Arundo donax TaxID=35708 RepID=A0A0A9H984_ARUDO